MLVNSITGTIRATILEGRTRPAGHKLAGHVVAIGIQYTGYQVATVLKG